MTDVPPAPTNKVPLTDTTPATAVVVEGMVTAALVTKEIDELNKLFEDTTNVPALRNQYRRILSLLPSSAAIWYSWLQFEYRMGDYEQLEKLFGECLKPYGTVKMWKLYLQYVLLCNSAPTSSPTMEATAVAEREAARRQTIIKAYELALNAIGLDYGALPIYRDYLAFIGSWPCNSLYEQQVQMDQMRKVYHRALVQPLEGLESLWSAYDAYENGLNKMTAKKMLTDRSAPYMAARSAAKELHSILATLERTDEYCLDPEGGLTPEMAAWKLSEWMRWIEWEQGNPANLSPVMLQSRVIYAFKSALNAVLRPFPEAHHVYARYLMGVGKRDEAEGVLRTACDILPANPMVVFALIDHLESSSPAVSNGGKEEDKFIIESKQLFERLLSTLQAQLTEAEAKGEATDAKRSAYTLGCIQFMHWSRRVEGITAARAIFSRCRKQAHIGHHMFTAAALMESVCKKDAIVAGKIFELGMAKFGTNPDFVLEYLRHLLKANDEQNARALFERALQGLPSPGDALEIWKCYLEHIFVYGDMATIRQLTQRFQDAYPDQLISRDLSIFTRQFSYGDISPTDDRIWGVLQGSVTAPSVPPRRLPKPLCIPDLLWELMEKLPPAATYDGPIINADGLVRLLQVVRLLPESIPFPSGPGAVTRTSATSSSSANTKSRATSSASTSASAPAKSVKRTRRDRLADDGDARDRAEPTRPIPRENDLFAQRYQERHK